MNIKKLNRKGFSHVEMAIVVLVVAALGFVGYRVLKNTSHAGSNCSGQTLSLNSSGQCVIDMQNLIYAFNVTKADVAVTGTFTANTKNAVLAFQQNVFASNKSQWNGIAGPNTWTKLCTLVPALQNWTAYQAQLDACGKTNIKATGPSASGPLRLNRPASLNIASDGMLWVVNNGHNVLNTTASVEMINVATGKLVNIMGDTSDQKRGGGIDFIDWWTFSSTFDNEGNLYVSGMNADGYNVKKISKYFDHLDTFQWNPKSDQDLSYPYSLARGKNGIIFAATGINSDNLSTTLAYNSSKDGSFSLFTDGTYGKSNINDIGKYTYTPHSMVIQNDNLAWIANPANNNLISVDLNMGNQNSYGNSSQSKGLGLFNPTVLNIDSKNRLWVLNNGTSLTSSLSVLDTSGKVPLLVKTISLSTSLNKGQTSIDFHRSSMISYGNYIWISDTANNCMYQVNINTYSVKAFGNGSGNYAFNGNTEMAVDAKGNLFVSNTDSNTITELNANTGALVQVLN